MSNRLFGLETEYGHIFVGEPVSPEDLTNHMDGSFRAMRIFERVHPNLNPNRDFLSQTWHYPDGASCRIDSGDFDPDARSLEYRTKPEVFKKIFDRLIAGDMRMSQAAKNTPYRLFRASLDYQPGSDDEVPALLGTHYNFDPPLDEVWAKKYIQTGEKRYSLLVGKDALVIRQTMAMVSNLTGSGYYDVNRDVFIPSDRIYGLHRAMNCFGYEKRERFLPTARGVVDPVERIHLTELDSNHFSWSFKVAVGLLDILVCLFGRLCDVSHPDLFNCLRPFYSTDRVHNDRADIPISLMQDLGDWLERLILLLDRADMAEEHHWWALNQYLLAVDALKQGREEDLLGLSEWLTVRWCIDQLGKVDPWEKASVALEFKAVESPLRDEALKMFNRFMLKTI